MGIELPSPQGEHLHTAGNVERVTPIQGSELTPGQQFVERNATESPSSQETRTQHGAGDGAIQSTQTDVTSATNSASTDQSATAAISLDDVPVVAADEDLIEKQWVDSVKRIVKDTRSDPYKQGEAISRLQADYLQKRYGKMIAGGENAA